MGWFDPIRSRDEKFDKKVILNVSKMQLEKDLNKITKKIDKTTKELREMCPFATTKKRLVAKSSKLDAECWERDEIKRRLQIIEEWEI